MKTIWKFPLVFSDMQYVDMPAGARILTMQAQRETACIWALVDPNRPEVQRHTIHTYGTGDTLPDDPGTYLGTYQTSNGIFVWHVFGAVNQGIEAISHDHKEALERLART